MTVYHDSESTVLEQKRLVAVYSKIMDLQQLRFQTVFFTRLSSKEGYCSKARKKKTKTKTMDIAGTKTR
jgi:hypothetical protein